MFTIIIKRKNSFTLADVVRMLAFYNMTPILETDNENITFTVDISINDADNYRLAEMYFQMNHHQRCNDDGTLTFYEEI